MRFPGPLKRLIAKVKAKLSPSSNSLKVQIIDDPVEQSMANPLDAPVLKAEIKKVVVQDPTDEQLAMHVAAYNKARYYHVTSVANVDGILKTGLDPKKGGTDTGLTLIADAKHYLPHVVGRAHVGGTRETSIQYEMALKGKKVEPRQFRVFVTPEQDQKLAKDLDTPDEANVYGYKTEEHLPPQQLMLGTFDQQNREKLRSVFSIVQKHYPKGSQVPVDTIIEWHFIAMKKGLLSRKLAHARYCGGKNYESF